jgi:hypothetical protein
MAVTMMLWRVGTTTVKHIAKCKYAEYIGCRTMV